MEKGNIFTVPFRRKREGRTYYKKRLKILLSSKYRFVVRKSLRGLHIALVEYGPKGDKVVLAASSKALTRLGWKGDTGNLPSAYLTGFFIGKKAIEGGVKEAIFDIGFSQSVKGSRLYAALAGAIDSGLKIPHNPDVLPPKDRISGEHISKYAFLLKNNKQLYEKQFSGYLKRGILPEDAPSHFKEIKGKMHG